MRYKISGKNIEVTPGLKDAVQEKIGKLERYFNQDTEANITLSVEKGRQKIEVTIPVKGHIIRAEQESSDMYVSIDLVEEIIERQLKKYKTKLIDKKQSALSFSEAFLQEEMEAPDEEIKIMKVKRFGMKPMDPEEACIQMELLGHAFYVFLNADTDEVNVVYKRKNNTYGPVSYTHLDVYKRQLHRPGLNRHRSLRRKFRPHHRHLRRRGGPHPDHDRH